MLHNITRALVFIGGYPDEDWPPGREALRAYDDNYRARQTARITGAEDDQTADEIMHTPHGPVYIWNARGEG